MKLQNFEMRKSGVLVTLSAPIKSICYDSVYLHPKLPQDLHRKLPHPESLIMAHI